MSTTKLRITRRGHIVFGTIGFLAVIATTGIMESFL